MIQKNYTMEVLLNGKPAREYYKDGRAYIEGRKGSVFSIRLRNNSSERVLFVPTVDGLSVMDGKDGSFDSRGYIVDGYSSMVIDGWRLSDDDVAEFYFSSPENSYRERSNKGNNIGSIAVAVFKEKQKPVEIHHYHYPSDPFPAKPQYPAYPWWNGNGTFYTTSGFDSSSVMLSASSLDSSNTSSAPVSEKNFRCSSVKQDVGTGFGQTKRSEVVSVSFDRESSPDTVIELLYNTREQLENLGINFSKKVEYVSAPNSFPKANGYRGYCEPPRK